MPRTFAATVALISVLGIVALLAILSVAQTHRASQELIDVRQGLNDLNRTMTRIERQLERGVAISGQAGTAGGSDRYAQALQDPDNLLSATTDQLIYPDAVPGGTLRRQMSSDPAGFNWLTENSVDVSEIQTYVHDTFARMDFNDPDSWVPNLAYKITANEDRTEYTVYLREGVYWQTPNVDMSDPRYEWLRERREVTADDAIFYYEMARNPEVEAAHIANYVEDITDVIEVDRYTFKILWDRPVYHSESTVMGGYPLPRWLFSRDRNGEEYPEELIPSEFNNHWSVDTPIGTGPYLFNRWDASDRIVLDRNEDYWGEMPPIERIEYRIIRDPEAAFAALRTGQLDFLPALASPRYRSEILNPSANSPFESGELEYDIIDEFAYFYIGWNADTPIFSDRRVREAMTLAFNRQGIIDNVFFGLGVIQNGPYYYDHPANNPNIETLPFDLERAAELLDEAGWIDTTGDGIRNKTIDGERHDFRFTLVAYNRPDVHTWVSVYREDLRRLGIDMRADHVEWALMQQRMEEKQFDAFTGGWGLGWHVDLYQIWHSSQADIPRGSNRVGFRNAEADELIEALRETFDPEERQQLMWRFHEIVHEEQPYTFFYARRSAVAWRPHMQNMVFQRIRPQTYSLPWYIDESAN